MNQPLAFIALLSVGALILLYGVISFLCWYDDLLNGDIEDE